MQKQSPHNVPVEVPDVPDEAINADNADPGTISEQLEQHYEDNPAPEEEDNPAQGEDSDEDELHSIKIKLTDDEDNPVPREPYKIKLPSGRVIRGQTDENGEAEIEGLTEGGNAEVSFPGLHGAEWKSG